MNNLLTTTQVLKLVPYSRTKLCEMVDNGDFPLPNKTSYKKKWLFDESEVNNWINFNIKGESNEK